MSDIINKLLKRTIPDDDCLIWEGCLNSDGYPRCVWKGSTNGKVHRIVYELYYKQDIDGLVVRHKCDNPLCINPSHLEIGTNVDNLKDRHDRGRTHKQVFKIEQGQIERLREDGLTYQQIADTLGIKPKRVEWVLAERYRRERRGG